MTLPTLKELLESVEPAALAASLESQYPELSADMYGVWEHLCKLEPVKQQAGERLVVAFERKQEEDGTPYVEVHARRDREGKGPKYYALDFTPWAEMLGYPVDLSDADFVVSPLEAVVQCLWEMTYYGFTEQTVATASDCLDQKFVESVQGAIETGLSVVTGSAASEDPNVTL